MRIASTRFRMMYVPIHTHLPRAKQVAEKEVVVSERGNNK